MVFENNKWAKSLRLLLEVDKLSGANLWLEHDLPVNDISVHYKKMQL
jgi:hypothetical protein